MSIEAMKSTFECAKKNERHDKVSETRYWCDQYRMLTEWAIKLLEKSALSSRVNDARVHAEHDKQRNAAMRRLTEAETTLDKSGTVAVDHEYFWRSMDTCPRGVKVQLLGAGGVAMYGIYNGRDTFYTHWAPLPKKPKE